MLTVDIKSLLRRLNIYCTASLEGAAGLCVSRTHYEVTVEHLLVKLLDNPQADMALILNHFEVDAGRLQKALAQTLEAFKTGNAAKPVFSPLLLEWIQEAWLVGSVDLDEARVRSGALLLAFLNRSRQLAGGDYVELLTAISRDALLSGFWDVVKGSAEKAVREAAVEAEAGPPGEATALNAFAPISPPRPPPAKSTRYSGATAKSARWWTSWPAAAKTTPLWWAKPAWARPPWWKGWPCGSWKATCPSC
jgi:type VI secretion system protein VasG